MKLIRIPVLMRFTKKNIRRTPYQAIAASLVMFLTFLVVTLFILVATGSQSILNYYETKPQAIAFFKDGTTMQDVQKIEANLNKTKKIKSFKYVSQNAALQIYRQRNKNNPLLLDLVTANILPASLEISTKTPEDLQVIATLVQKEPVVSEVIFPSDAVHSLTQATRLIRVVGGTIAGFLILFSILIVMMITGFKIRNKRNEIEIMRLLGASNFFIQLPFLSEGMFYAIVGAVSGWFIGFVVIWYFQPLIQKQLGEVSSAVFPISPIFIVSVLLIEIVIALFVGGLGALIGVRRAALNSK